MKYYFVFYCLYPHFFVNIIKDLNLQTRHCVLKKYIAFYPGEQSVGLAELEFREF